MLGVAGIIAANSENLLAPMWLVVLVSAFYLRCKDLPSIKGTFNLIQLAALR
jgi:chromate transport protein ChrA